MLVVSTSPFELQESIEDQLPENEDPLHEEDQPHTAKRGRPPQEV